jgi:hypothetical protein
MLPIKTFGMIGGCPTLTFNVGHLKVFSNNQVCCPKATQGVVLIPIFRVV